MPTYVQRNRGWRRIRTFGILTNTLIFKTNSLNRSDIHPFISPNLALRVSHNQLSCRITIPMKMYRNKQKKIELRHFCRSNRIQYPFLAKREELAGLPRYSKSCSGQVCYRTHCLDSIAGLDKSGCFVFGLPGLCKLYYYYHYVSNFRLGCGTQP